MATFLALQLETSGDNDMKITVFAPIDEAIPNSVTKFSDYITIFRGHVINRLLSWKDLQKLASDESILKTVLKSYEIEVSLSGDILLSNGVPLIYPDMYIDEWVSVNGFNQMIEPKANQAKLGESISVLNDGEGAISWRGNQKSI
ncbi:putative fasciclin-like arabinogalactan protein 20 [Cardamine amara subsp. amara]|uniref:Fasciclin-like arabinogalactan protein 20 n=1 Tax=Cardamine amara subsp. amara TaxID=228776 RepID=A0ABD0ZYH1_CARAN